MGTSGATNAAPDFSSELTEKLSDDAENLTTFSAPGEVLPLDQQDSLLSELIEHYDQADGEIRAVLAQLAPLLDDGNGPQLRAMVSKPGRAEVTISDDGLEACLSLVPPEVGGKALSTNDVISLLREKGVVYGVDIRAINQMVSETAKPGAPCVKDIIAIGRPAVNGEAGRIEILAEQTIPSGNNKKLQCWMTTKGQSLAPLVLPSAGTPGTDVLGRSLPAAPGPIPKIELVGPLDYDAATQTYISRIDGLASYNGHALEVCRQLIWQGDFTRNDPPINFDGSVVIRGNVRDGAKIEATENIEITGGVEGATVISRTGGLTIRQGIAGRHCAFISAATMVDVRYLENATVYCAGDIRVGHGVINSKVVVGGAVHAELGKGVIFGGETRAGSMIAAKFLGNAAGVATKVSVGHDWGAMEQLRDHEEILSQLKQQIALGSDLIAKFRLARPDASRLSERERHALGALLKRHVLLLYKLKSQQKQYDDLDTHCSDKGGGKITSYDTIYAGTLLKIGAVSHLISSSVGACSIRLQPEKRMLVASTISGRPMNLP